MLPREMYSLYLNNFNQYFAVPNFIESNIKRNKKFGLSKSYCVVKKKFFNSLLDNSKKVYTLDEIKCRLIGSYANHVFRTIFSRAAVAGKTVLADGENNTILKNIKILVSDIENLNSQLRDGRARGEVFAFITQDIKEFFSADAGKRLKH